MRVVILTMPMFSHAGLPLTVRNLAGQQTWTDVELNTTSEPVIVCTHNKNLTASFAALASGLLEVIRPCATALVS